MVVLLKPGTLAYLTGLLWVEKVWRDYDNYPGLLGGRENKMPPLLTGSETHPHMSFLLLILTGSGAWSGKEVRRRNPHSHLCHTSFFPFSNTGRAKRKSRLACYWQHLVNFLSIWKSWVNLLSNSLPQETLRCVANPWKSLFQTKVHVSVKLNQSLSCSSTTYVLYCVLNLLLSSPIFSSTIYSLSLNWSCQNNQLPSPAHGCAL